MPALRCSSAQFMDVCPMSCGTTASNSMYMQEEDLYPVKDMPMTRDVATRNRALAVNTIVIYVNMSRRSLTLLPVSRYALPITAPIRARTSPVNAFLSSRTRAWSPLSPAAITTLPRRHRIVPAIISACCFSFSKNQEKIPTNMGFVVTSTTLLATDVYFRDVVQNIKCSPRNTPPASESNRSLLHTVLNEMPFIPENTRRIMDATHILYVAIIIAGTSSQNLMNIAAKDMETITTNSIAMVRTILFSKTQYHPR